MTVKNLLDERLPNLVAGRKWTIELVICVACFLGNDFLKRNPGNSPTKVVSFVQEVTNVEGLLVDDDTLFNCLFQKTLTPTNCSKEEKEKWDPAMKRSYLKKWKEAMGMFTHGPAFLLFNRSTQSTTNQSLRENIRIGNYTVNLGSMSGQADVQWSLSNPSQSDQKFGRTHLVGFDPKDDLLDELSLRKEFIVSSNTNEDEDGHGNIGRETVADAFQSILVKLCKLQIWSKKGKDVISLPDPKSERGRDLFHGSIIDFEKVPVRYHSKEELTFWLQSRQIKVPDRISQIRELVMFVDTKLGDTLQPIPKELMRGSSGYRSPVVLQPQANCDKAKHMVKDEFLTRLKEVFPSDMDDPAFYGLFGKRNGTRFRAMKHIEGGSFDINQMKLTEDLISSLDPEAKIIVISGACAPSQKLKEKSQHKFYEIQLVLELDENDKFKSFLPHPATNCKCPNGCILCAHLGAMILLCYALCNYDNVKMNDNTEGEEDIHPPALFENIRLHLPAPVNSILTRPMPSQYAFPSNDSKVKTAENQYRREQDKNNKKKKKKQPPEAVVPLTRSKRV